MKILLLITIVCILLLVRKNLKLKDKVKSLKKIIRGINDLIQKGG